MAERLEIRNGLREGYDDVYTPEALAALAALASFDRSRRRLMDERMRRRVERERRREPLCFLDEDVRIPGTSIRVGDARAGRFSGSEIPGDLVRQWIQGTGPATRPRASVANGLRNIAYALLSGADGWMFDGEDALGQIETMSLDNQRNLRIALASEERFLDVAERVAGEMNGWAHGFFGRDIVRDWQAQLAFTTVLFRPRGLHLEDRHLRHADGGGFSASIADLVLYVTANAPVLRREGRTLALYLPKIQTAGEAALWNDLLDALEEHLGLGQGSIKAYVLVEQIEACFQLMEIRAALGRHFVGFNTGRWDYINSVADARRWDRDFVDPNIDEIGMT